MILSDCMDQISAQLDTIAGLRCFAYPPDSVVPPAAFVSFPSEYQFDGTYGRGMDMFHLGVLVVVGKTTDRVTRDLISAYVNGSGTKSVKAVLEAGTYTAFEVIHVASVAFDTVQVAGTDYLAAEFTLEITGSGS
nr:hypothetical protein Hi04_10k_c361_00016 [uncultured bacterium]